MTEAEINDALVEYNIPSHMHGGIKRYLINRIAPEIS